MSEVEVAPVKVDGGTKMRTERRGSLYTGEGTRLRSAMEERLRQTDVGRTFGEAEMDSFYSLVYGAQVMDSISMEDQHTVLMDITGELGPSAGRIIERIMGSAENYEAYERACRLGRLRAESESVPVTFTVMEAAFTAARASEYPFIRDTEKKLPPRDKEIRELLAQAVRPVKEEWTG